MAVQRCCVICGALSDRARCPEHRPARESAAARGYDSTWRRTRGRYLSAHPTCERSGCSAPATEVHHLDGLGPNGPRGHDHRNLLACCKSCHAQITARMQPAGWAAGTTQERSPDGTQWD